MLFFGVQNYIFLQLILSNKTVYCDPVIRITAAVKVAVMRDMSRRSTIQHSVFVSGLHCLGDLGMGQKHRVHDCMDADEFQTEKDDACVDVLSACAAV
jgi:predicted small integral membrane protein